MIKFVTNRSDHNVSYERATIEECIAFIDSIDVVGLDTELNSLNPHKSDLLLIQVGNKDLCYVIDCSSVDYMFLKQFENKKFIGQNLKFEASQLRTRGIFIDVYWDTMIVDQCLGLGSGRRNSLDAILERRLGISATHTKSTRDEFINRSPKTPFQQHHITYAAEDVIYLEAIKDVQDKLIDKLDIRFWIEQIEIPLISILAKAEVEGLLFNTEKWLENVDENEDKKFELELEMDKEIRALSKSYPTLNGGIYTRDRVKEQFIQTDIFGIGSIVENENKGNINYGSSNQIKDIFYRVNEKPPVKTGTTKDTVGQQEIEQYILANPASVLIEMLNKLLKHKEVTKAIDSFGRNFLDIINIKTGHVHTIYRQAMTTTGRLASGDMKNGFYNSQQVPKENKYRNCFGTDPGYNMVTIDLSGAELIILASLAEDDKLIDLQSKDIHSHLATACWREVLKDPEYVVSKTINKHKRDEFKSVVYGLAYGCTSKRVAELLGISTHSANSIIMTMRREIPKTFDYLDKVSYNGVKNGYVLLSKRTNARRWFPGVLEHAKSINYLKEQNVPSSQWPEFPFKKRGEIERESKNSPIQATNAFVIKEAIVVIDKWIMDNNIDGNLLLNVHDELVYRYPDTMDESFPPMVKKLLLETANKYLVPGVFMDAEYHIAKTWLK